MRAHREQRVIIAERLPPPTSPPSCTISQPNPVIESGMTAESKVADRTVMTLLSPPNPLGSVPSPVERPDEVEALIQQGLVLEPHIMSHHVPGPALQRVVVGHDRGDGGGRRRRSGTHVAALGEEGRELEEGQPAGAEEEEDGEWPRNGGGWRDESSKGNPWAEGAG